MGNVEIPLGNTLPDMVIVIVLCVLVDTVSYTHLTLPTILRV